MIFGPDHVARHATEAEKRLQNSLYDNEKKEWVWDNCVALHKEQHAKYTWAYIGCKPGALCTSNNLDDGSKFVLAKNPSMDNAKNAFLSIHSMITK